MDTNAILEKDSRDSTEQAIEVIGFGRRLAATLYDGFFLAFLIFVLTFVVGFAGLLIGIYRPDDPLMLERLIMVCGLALSVVYYVGSWATSGQTLGKTLAGIKVISVDGSSVSLGKALLRYLGYILSGALLSLGFLWVALDPKRQGWHDKMAGTYVVHSDDIVSRPGPLKAVPADPNRGPIWLIAWTLLAIGLPAGLFASLWVLGPFMSRLVVDMIRGLA